MLATSYIYDINKLLDEPLNESDDYETLAGLLFSKKPQNLREGEEFVIEGYKMKTLKMNRSLSDLVELKYVRKKEEEQ